MPRATAQLQADIERIWRAGVAAVSPELLIQSHVHVDGQTFIVDDEVVDLSSVNRVAIVGAGKAAGAMGIALETALGPSLLAEKQVVGWINVPADCVLPAQHVVLHAARPAGINQPRPEGIVGTQRILEMVGSLGPNDLCICVLSGGGSALLPAPVPQVSLDDKIRLTRRLSAAGANIEQLNVVRRHVSIVKGGGLARACRAGRMIVLLISDVLGDSLDVISSGPTVTCSGTARQAVDVLQQLHLTNEPEIASIVRYLGRARDEQEPSHQWQCEVSHFILGNNATAVDGAGVEAERLGYSHAMISAKRSEGPAEDIGNHLATMARRMRNETGPDCLISGGEPTVTLVDESRRGKGGRNQQLALAALANLGNCDGIAFMSAGTDGEDGPTNAAGAFVTPEIVARARKLGLESSEFLARNDAYRFFEQAGGLFITGPTQTNVCDLRVIVVDRESNAGDQSHHH